MRGPTATWAPAPAGRSALLAVVLSGLGPGAGHVYAGRWRRGAVLVALVTAASVAWILEAPRSFALAKAFAWPPLLLLLGLLVDSGRMARAAPRPFPLGPLNRWWIYCLVIAATGFVGPSALERLLSSRAGLAQADAAMAPALVPLDLVVFDRRPGALVRGDVVAVARSGSLGLRRLVGLPGDTVELRRGVVNVAGQAWIADAERGLRSERSFLPPERAGAGEALVLSDRRSADEGASWRVRLSDVAGRATWVLLPGDHDPARIGEAVR